MRTFLYFCLLFFCFCGTWQIRGMPGRERGCQIDCNSSQSKSEFLLFFIYIICLAFEAFKRELGGKGGAPSPRAPSIENKLKKKPEINFFYLKNVISYVHRIYTRILSVCVRSCVRAFIPVCVQQNWTLSIFVQILAVLLRLLKNLHFCRFLNPLNLDRLKNLGHRHWLPDKYECAKIDALKQVFSKIFDSK